MRFLQTAMAFTVFLFLAVNTHAAKFKVSTAYPDGTYIVKSLKKAGKEIEEKTEGRVKFKFYPGGVQGDKKTVQKKIKRGILHGAIVEGGALASAYKASQVYNAPMLFRSTEEVQYVRSKMDSVFLDGFLTGGWKTFGLVDGGFAYAMTNKPVSGLDVLKQQKLWLPANDPLSEKIAGSLGLSPIYLGIGEVLTALQTGAIDAIATPPGAAITLQWYSKVKYVTDVPFMYTYGMFSMSEKAWKKISPEDQKIVDAVFSAALQDCDQTSYADGEKAFQALKSQGLEMVEPSEAELVKLREESVKATQVLVDNGEIPADVLTQVNQLLTEFRAK